MKILIVTQWFEPEFTLKGLLLAEELKRKGHEIEILTGFPNYPEGKIYPGYKMKPFQREKINGISVIRCALYPSHDSSALRRSANFMSFSLSAAFWGILLCRRPDVIYAYHPPITVGLIAVILSWFKRAPFILDIQDFWPDTLKSTGMMSNRFLYRCVGWACEAVYRLSSKIVVLSKGFKRLLMERGVPKEKINVIYNWADERYIHAVPYNKELARSMEFSGNFNVVYAGTMGKAQNLFNVLDAAEVLHKSYPEIRFVFIGAGVDKDMLKKYARKKELKNVVFEPRKPVSEILEILAIADVLLLHLKNDPLFEITVPSKTQANLCVGRPNLAVCLGDACKLIEEADAGLSCPPGDPEELAKKIIQLYLLPPKERLRMGENGKRYYKEKLSLSKGVEKTIHTLQQTIGINGVR